MSDKPDEAEVKRALERAAQWCNDDNRDHEPLCEEDTVLLADQVAWQDGEIEWRDDVLGMIVQRLIHLGCCCEEHDGSSTPPMSYDDWITCVVAKRERNIKRLKTLERLCREELSDQRRAAVVLPDSVIEFLEAEPPEETT